MKLMTTFALVGAFALAAPALADERPDHFEAKPSPTLEAALDNLAEYNPKLAALVEKESLNPEDLNDVHQLTYTLEQALEKLGEEKDRVAALLEEVHLASESADAETVKRSGKAYLEGTAPLTH
ncbi:DUF6746 family protein [Marinobacter shengliensis]|jgi:hypothetical protein|uniref:DUF6746 family protein n=1 Tax=Marinobacter shengliensis TaxID=1389223 RepID=UPI002573FAD0|nr:DUF6746 family protein [Marinobacter shengliensis]BEH15553.1 hypothetical protein MAALD49_29210 [Marinobacter shengliensis]